MLNQNSQLENQNLRDSKLSPLTNFSYTNFLKKGLSCSSNRDLEDSDYHLNTIEEANLALNNALDDTFDNLIEASIIEESSKRIEQSKLLPKSEVDDILADISNISYETSTTTSIEESIEINQSVIDPEQSTITKPLIKLVDWTDGRFKTIKKQNPTILFLKKIVESCTENTICGRTKFCETYSNKSKISLSALTLAIDYSKAKSSIQRLNLYKIFTIANGYQTTDRFISISKKVTNIIYPTLSVEKYLSEFVCWLFGLDEIKYVEGVQAYSNKDVEFLGCNSFILTDIIASLDIETIEVLDRIRYTEEYQNLKAATQKNSELDELNVVSLFEVLGIPYHKELAITNHSSRTYHGEYDNKEHTYVKQALNNGEYAVCNASKEKRKTTLENWNKVYSSTTNTHLESHDICSSHPSALAIILQNTEVLQFFNDIKGEKNHVDYNTRKLVAVASMFGAGEKTLTNIADGCFNNEEIKNIHSMNKSFRNDIVKNVAIEKRIDDNGETVSVYKQQNKMISLSCNMIESYIKFSWFQKNVDEGKIVDLVAVIHDELIVEVKNGETLSDINDQELINGLMNRDETVIDSLNKRIDSFIDGPYYARAKNASCLVESIKEVA